MTKFFFKKKTIHDNLEINLFFQKKEKQCSLIFNQLNMKKNWFELTWQAHKVIRRKSTELTYQTYDPGHDIGIAQ